MVMTSLRKEYALAKSISDCSKPCVTHNWRDVSRARQKLSHWSVNCGGRIPALRAPIHPHSWTISDKRPTIRAFTRYASSLQRSCHELTGDSGPGIGCLDRSAWSRHALAAHLGG